MAKWIVAEKVNAGLRHAVLIVYPSVTGRTMDRIAQSKRVRAGWLDIVDYYSLKWRERASSGRSVVLLWRYVCFVLFSPFCFH